MRIAVGPLSELSPGTAVVVSTGEVEIAVFNTGNGLFALDNRCAHRGGPISEGRVAGGVVTCPWHWWRYALSSGRRLGSEHVSLASYPVEVVDGVVLVDAPAPRDEPSSIRDRLLEHARHWSRER